jgi:CRP/FNR family transcriptional regulator
VTLYIFGPGDVFGFLPFLDGQGYPAYAQAMEDVEADVMARSTLLQVLRADPDVAMTLISLLGQRLRTAFDQIRTLSTPGSRARVAAALFALLSDSPTAGASGEVELPVTAHEFAAALGLVPETYSRALTSLVQDGILERTGPAHYRILDSAALERSSVPTD